jgi:hypothetical protein
MKRLPSLEGKEKEVIHKIVHPAIGRALKGQAKYSACFQLLLLPRHLSHSGRGVFSGSCDNLMGVVS